MEMNYYGKYCRGWPPGYSMFLWLNQHTDPTKAGFFVCIDNDDHAVSKEFYELRRVIRVLEKKGLDVKVFINPRFPDKTAMEVWVQKQLPEHTIFLNYKEEEGGTE
jgi:predicted deacetylase